MLYLVATPIGNLMDITLRALHILKEVDMIVCEDKRVSLKLLNHYGISKPLLSYHDHNASQIRPRIINFLQEGKKIALISDGGMPLISDPGFKLILECQQKKLPHTVIPGVSAPLMALCLSGLSPDRFLFCGFLSSKQEARRKHLEELEDIPSTLIFFESPKRLLPFLKDALEILSDREAAVCREMTKLYENVQKKNISDLITFYEIDPPRGELVIVIAGKPSSLVVNKDECDVWLEKALETHSLKEAVEIVSKALKFPKKETYQRALTLKSQKARLSEGKEC